MKETTVTLAEAARHLDDWVERANCEGTTIVFVKDGHPVARLVPESRGCSGRELAAALSHASLPDAEAAAWFEDMRAPRDTLTPPCDKWR